MADVVVGISGEMRGKGKIVDRIAKDYDFVVRYQGGHNAGHTIVHKGVKHSFAFNALRGFIPQMQEHHF